MDIDVWLGFGITGLVALAMYTLAQLRREPLQELSTRIEALQKRMKLPKIAQKVKGLYKSRKDKIVGGVAAGLAEKLEVSPGLLRLLLLVLIPVTSGAVVFIYFLLAIFLPFAPNQDKL
jgi:phage shock protein PspC (stress-responsive transcriptional regulator)